MQPHTLVSFMQTHRLVGWRQCEADLFARARWRQYDTHLSYPHHIPVAASLCALSTLFVEVMAVCGYGGMWVFGCVMLIVGIWVCDAHRAMRLTARAIFSLANYRNAMCLSLSFCLPLSLVRLFLSLSHSLSFFISFALSLALSVCLEIMTNEEQGLWMLCPTLSLRHFL